MKNLAGSIVAKPGMVVWKSSFSCLKAEDVMEVSFPSGWELLSVGCQGLGRDTQICFWGLVDPSVPIKTTRKFVCYGTGRAITKEDLKYIQTLSLFADGSLVLHVFEIL